MNPERQFELNFAAIGGADGLNAWREQRSAKLHAIARQKDLPLGKIVEVWLAGGIRLRGHLRLSEEMLFIEETIDPDLRLKVDDVLFKESEIESCLRMD